MTLLSAFFVPVDLESLYDDLEAILYVGWVEEGWHTAKRVTPSEIDA